MNSQRERSWSMTGSALDARASSTSRRCVRHARDAQGPGAFHFTFVEPTRRIREKQRLLSWSFLLCSFLFISNTTGRGPRRRRSSKITNIAGLFTGRAMLVASFAILARTVSSFFWGLLLMVNGGVGRVGARERCGEEGALRFSMRWWLCRGLHFLLGENKDHNADPSTFPSKLYDGDFAFFFLTQPQLI